MSSKRLFFADIYKKSTQQMISASHRPEKSTLKTMAKKPLEVIGTAIDGTVEKIFQR